LLSATPFNEPKGNKKMGLLQDARNALDKLAGVAATAAPVVAAAEQAATAPVPTVTEGGSLPPASVTTPQSQVETSPAPMPTPPPATGIVADIDKYAGDVEEVADLIPGAHNIVALLTLVVQLSNTVEALVNDMKTHSPIAWAQIANTFSSAVQEYESLPKN
jgi:uncharacterized phage infection (PIP) family protein YhgE